MQGIITIMKYFLTLFLLMGINFAVLSDDQDVEHSHEDNEDLYGENSCDNDIDDDMDGDTDGDDEDCSAAVVVLDNTILGDLSNVDLNAYLVWGVGIALLSSVESSSGTGTATTD